jgi:hypothetical protein
MDINQIQNNNSYYFYYNDVTRNKSDGPHLKKIKLISSSSKNDKNKTDSNNNNKTNSNNNNNKNISNTIGGRTPKKPDRFMNNSEYSSIPLSTLRSNSSSKKRIRDDDDDSLLNGKKHDIIYISFRES